MKEERSGDCNIKHKEIVVEKLTRWKVKKRSPLMIGLNVLCAGVKLLGVNELKSEADRG